MRIAVNTRLLLPEKLDGIGWFTHEVLSRITSQHPEHEFLFLFDRAFNPKYKYSENVQMRVSYPPARHPLLYRMFFEYSVPLAIRQWKPDLFFSPDGFLSTKVRVPQIPVIHDINFEHRPEDLPKKYSAYYRTNFPVFAKLAKEIITVSEYSANDIAQTYEVDRSKIFIANNGGNEAYHRVSESEQKKAKAKYTNGSSYFVFVGNFSFRKNVHGVIESYNLYRESGGNQKLVLVGDPLWTYDEMEKALNNSPHAADIILTGHLPIEELVVILGSATALVFPSFFEGFGIPVVEAFRAEVPVITSNATSLPEVAGDAAILVDPEDHKGIATAMLDLEVNEDKRKALVDKGLIRSQLFTWDQCANKIAERLFH